jgi:NADPH-dependent 2,4-dienoyl-CoA reductase/sulfur reductase-like enzyme
VIERVELAVVGAGPAGMEAAITAAEAGLEVTLLDSYPRPGGQYFKQAPIGNLSVPETLAKDIHTSRHRSAQAVFQRLERANVRVLADTLVWGAFPASDGEGWLITLHGTQTPRCLQAQALVLATGAYDRPIPFPGWTLPGVMTAGAAQILLKSQGVLPGRRILLSGTGPFQLAVAAQLIHYGAEVVGVLEGAAIGWRDAHYALAMRGQWARLREGWSYWRALRRAKVPIRAGWAVIEARGDGKVVEAVIARLDEDWGPIAGSRQTIPIDTLIVGYGFIPSTELGRVLGCQHDFRPDLGSYVPHRDDDMQTTLPDVYIVGDGAGIGGAELARLEGQIAGLAVAQRLGTIDGATAQEAIARRQPALARERRFARLLSDLFTPGSDLYQLATDDTVICRCEDVRLGEIQDAVAGGARTTNEVKGLTRVGMGNCQGRVCGELVARAIANQLGASEGHLPDIEAAGIFTARPPIHPLPLSALADVAEVLN